MKFLKPKNYSISTSGKIRNAKPNTITRREFFERMAAAGVAVATTDPFWEMGKKLISIPSGRIFTKDPFSIDAQGNITITMTQPEDRVTVLDLHRWLQDMADDVDNDDLLDITDPNPSIRATDNIITLNDGYYVKNPEFLQDGSLQQKGEFWAGIQSVGQVRPDTIALVNGKPAIRPGHVNQCVKGELGDKVLLQTTTYGNLHSEFEVTTQHGVTVGALAEAPDLFYNHPMDDPCYELYKQTETRYKPCSTSKGQRLGMKEYERNL